MKATLRLAHLYPKLMNIYGDRGNILCLARRCGERGIGFELTELEPGDPFQGDDFDMVFIGGAQDREQQRVAEDLVSEKGEALRQAVEAGVTVLAVCGGYQLLGRYYRAADGDELPGVGVFGTWTEHPGPGADRFIGNVVVEWNGETLVGFENHGGRTYLDDGVAPLARIVTGMGNNGLDGGEGAVRNNAYGTYLHGSLLPKNPAFADHLLQKALRRRYKGLRLKSLDDRIEEMAHAAAVRLASGRGIISS
ncbi:MAG: glutamine amidotransferase [Dehalococcoidia bacterium]